MDTDYSDLVLAENEEVCNYLTDYSIDAKSWNKNTKKIPKDGKKNKNEKNVPSEVLNVSNLISQILWGALLLYRGARKLAMVM